MRKHIRIVNPLNGPGWTSRQRAKRYVARGLAVWDEFGVSIRFLRSSNDHRERSAQRAVDETAIAYDRAARTGLARVSELANLPMVAPAVLLNFGRRKGASANTFRGF